MFLKANVLFVLALVFLAAEVASEEPASLTAPPPAEITNAREDIDCAYSTHLPQKDANQGVSSVDSLKSKGESAVGDGFGDATSAIATEFGQFTSLAASEGAKGQQYFVIW